MLRFYDCATAPSPRRTRMLLHEKNIPHKSIQVDLRNNEQLSESFRAINPRCSVPFIVTPEGIGISENVAIATYLEEMFPTPAMLGTTPIERAKILEWNARIEFDAFMSIQEVLRNTSPKLKNRALPGPQKIDQIPALAQRGKTRLSYFYEEFEERLSRHEFVAGSQFSFADITALVAIDFSSWVKLAPDPKFSAIQNWYHRMKKRASFAI